MQPPHRPSARLLARRRPDAGFTLVELAVALLLLMVGLATLSTALVESLRLGASNREAARTLDRTRELVARVSALPFRDLLRSFNADELDDPGGAGTAPGRRFSFPDLRPVAADAEPEGREVLVAVELPLAPGAARLREDAQLPELGLPRDLNGDGDVDALDHDDDYVVLPVRLRLEWSTAAGTRSHDLVLLLRE